MDTLRHFYDFPKWFLVICLLLLISACNGNGQAPPPPETVEVILEPTEVPAVTAVELPIVTAKVGNSQSDEIPIAAGTKATIDLTVKANGKFEIKPFANLGFVEQDKGDALKFVYRAPPEGGGLATVSFEVKDANRSATADITFRVIDLMIDDPLDTIACDSRTLCEFTVQGTAAGVADDMAVVVFVRKESGDWTMQYGLDITEAGHWEVDAEMNETPAFAGENVILQAYIFPANKAIDLNSPVDQQPEAAWLADSGIKQLEVISPRLALAESIAQAEITSHKTGTEVPFNERVSVSGQVTDVSSDAGTVLWALVYTPYENYHPQLPSACADYLGTVIAGDGPWGIDNIIFGGNGGEQFEVVVVVAEENDPVDTFFQDYFQTACDDENFFGIPRGNLPAGITEAGSVTVITP